MSKIIRACVSFGPRGSSVGRVGAHAGGPGLLPVADPILGHLAALVLLLLDRRVFLFLLLLL